MVKERTEEEVVKEGDLTSSEAHVSAIYLLYTDRSLIKLLLITPGQSRPWRNINLRPRTKAVSEDDLKIIPSVSHTVSYTCIITAASSWTLSSSM